MNCLLHEAEDEQISYPQKTSSVHQTIRSMFGIFSGTDITNNTEKAERWKIIVCYLTVFFLINHWAISEQGNFLDKWYYNFSELIFPDKFSFKLGCYTVSKGKVKQNGWEGKRIQQKVRGKRNRNRKKGENKSCK